MNAAAEGSEDPASRVIKACIDRALSMGEVVEASERAIQERPANAPMRVPRGGPPQLERLRMAISTERMWQPGRTLRVRFLDGPLEVQTKVQAQALEWTEHANIGLEFGEASDAEIRISFQQQGSWSFIGTDAGNIPSDEPTMNFGWLRQGSSDDEYPRVVLHEFGHALGCIHEHQNPAAEGQIPWDKPAVYTFYAGPPNRWSKADVDVNIFQAYSRTRTQFSNFDPKSIMLYPIPNELTMGDYEVGLNSGLSDVDKDFISNAYPPSERPIVTLDVDGSAVRAGIGTNAEEDHYRFNVGAAGTVVIETEGPTDVVVGLYGPDSKTRLVTEDDDSGRGYNAKISALLMTGEYFLRVRHYSPSSTGEYGLSVRSEGSQ